MHTPPTRTWSLAGAVWLFVLVLPLSLAVSGCAGAGWLADGLTPGSQTVNVEAEYLGLEGQTVAVMVDTDISIAMAQPLAQLEVATVIAQRIADNVEGVTVRDPQDVVQFQEHNIYWTTMRYTTLMERLEVDRLVIVELVDYRLHEPGNVNIWRGLMTANVGVVEADSDSPNDQVYATTVTAQYPPDGEIGLLNADEQTMRLATLDRFSQHVAGKFYNHEQERQRRR